MPAISARGLGKCYRLGATAQHNTLRDHIDALVRGLARKGARQKGQTFWALRGVDLDIMPGEVTGIIGRNGAGKSTLLKILSQITEPTEGEVRLRGRIASLLEVGTGFHPELTGRENIFMNGAMLGMRRREIAAKFDAIAAFAEVETFLDTPVKRYSSGMYVRLAFAVAAHLEPEILLVDEVLAVGDAVFQKKCLGKMGDIAGSGRTLVFVSHNMVAVRNLCRRAVWLAEGRVVRDGPADEVVSAYLAVLRDSPGERVWDDPATAPGNERVRLASVSVKSKIGGLITMETEFDIEVRLRNAVEGQRLHVTVQVQNDQGIIAFAAPSYGPDGEPPAWRAGEVRAACTVPGDLLNSGVYTVNALVLRDGANMEIRADEAVSFEVAEPPTRPGSWFGRRQGVFRPKLAWRFEGAMEGGAR